MTMSIVDFESLRTEWVGKNGVRYVSTPTAGKGYLFALVTRVLPDGSREDFAMADLYAEDDVPGAFDAWRATRTGYAAPVAVAA